MLGLEPSLEPLSFQQKDMNRWVSPFCTLLPLDNCTFHVVGRIVQYVSHIQLRMTGPGCSTESWRDRAPASFRAVDSEKTGF